MRFEVDALVEWAKALLIAKGMDAAMAQAVASVLVEGDMLGHDTHGLALLAPNVAGLQSGLIKGQGRVDIISCKPAIQLWDGAKLPGHWLTLQAIQTASDRAREVGTCAITIRNSGHIGCLAAYLEAPARDGLMVEIYCSDPAVCSVAPFGGKSAVFTPNPIAFGIPTSGDPVMIDISTSITTNGMSARLAAAGQHFPGQWLLDGEGHPTDDPKTFEANPPGTIQLLGGLDAGHKGYGLTLLVEALTGGLAGYGRADGAKGWGATLMVRVTDADAFSGLGSFNRQLDWLTRACLDTPPIETAKPVRLPGQRGLERKRKALSDGLELNPVVLAAIGALAKKHNLPLPN